MHPVHGAARESGGVDAAGFMMVNMRLDRLLFLTVTKTRFLKSLFLVQFAHDSHFVEFVLLQNHGILCLVPSAKQASQTQITRGHSCQVHFLTFSCGLMYNKNTISSSSS